MKFAGGRKRFGDLQELDAIIRVKGMVGLL
jgi:hypothetical protein